MAFEGAPTGLICARPRASRQRYQRPILRDERTFAAVVAAPPTLPAFGDVGRSCGARICTLYLPGELASHGSPAGDLARVCVLAAAGRDRLARLECSWRQPEIPAGALLNRHLGGKVIFGID